MAMTVQAFLRLDASQFDRALNGAEDDLGNLGDAGERSGQQAARGAEIAGNAFGALGGIIQGALAVLSIDAWAQLTNDVIQYNDAINSNVAMLGLSREAMQTWGIAGKGAGVEIADVFKDMQEKIGEFASTGGGEAADVFKRLKLDVNELVALSPDQQLLKIGEAMSKVKDMSQGEKSFLLESLADDATRLLPLLDNNAAKLRELDSLARSSGALLDDDQNAILSEAKDNLDKIKLALDGAGNAAGVAGAEILNAFAGDAIDVIASASGAISLLDDALAAMAAVAVGRGVASLVALGIEAAAVAGSIGIATIATSAFNAALGLLGGPIGALIAVIGVAIYELEALQKQQDLESGAIETASGKWIKYADITSQASQLNREYTTASKEKKKAIEDELKALNSTTEAEIKSAAATLGATQAKLAAVKARFASQDYTTPEDADANKVVEGAYQRSIDQQIATLHELNAQLKGVANEQQNLGKATEVTSGATKKFYVDQEAVNKALSDGGAAAKKAGDEHKKAADAMKALNAPWLSGSVAFKSEIEAAAKRFNVDANLVKSIIQQETGFLKSAEKQLKAVSPAGAKGIMQVMPGTAAQVAKEIGMTNYSLFKAADNITLGTAYLSQQLAKYNGDITKVAAAYNAGPGAVDKYAGIPPYKETQGYVKNVLGYYKELTKGVDESGASQIKAIIKTEDERAKAAQKADDDRKKAAEQHAKEMADIRSSLDTDLLKSTASKLEVGVIDLKAKGFEGSDLGEQAAKQAAIALNGLQRSAEAARMEATLSKEAFREWQLVNEEGFSASVAAAQVALEEQTAAATDLRTIWDQTASKLEEALLSTVLTGKGDWGGLVDYMIQEATRLKVIKPLMESLTKSLGGEKGIMDGLGSLLGMKPYANGGAFAASGVQAYANGGAFHNSILTRPTQFFANGGLAVAGEAGAEAVMPLTRIGGKLGVMSTGGSNQVIVQPQITFTTINNAGAKVETKQQTDSAGNINITTMIDQVESAITDRARRGAGLANVFKRVG